VTYDGGLEAAFSLSVTVKDHLSSAAGNAYIKHQLRVLNVMVMTHTYSFHLLLSAL
jgi:hypothetical protein